MKKIVTLLMLFISTTSIAQTFNGDLTLTTQTQVNSFNYKVVTGTLTLSGSSITNINSLSSLDTVGNLYIQGTSITNVNGLNNLKVISGVGSNPLHSDLYFQNNQSLSDLTGLANTKFLGNMVLFFGGCGSLLNLNGVQNLDWSATSKSVVIRDCDKLTSLNGLVLPQLFPNDNRISDLTIFNNSKLTDVSALSGFSVGLLTIEQDTSLRKIDLSSAPAWRTYSQISILSNTNLKEIKFANNASNKITINFNQYLDSISGMNQVIATLPSFSFSEIMLFGNKLSYVDMFNFTTGLIPDRVNGDLLINGNTALKNVDFLNKIKYCDDLLISNNTSLTNCCGVYSLLNSNGVTNQISITNNPSACSNQSEIMSFCSGVNNLIFGQVYSDINSNNKPDASDIFIDNIKIQIAKNGNNTTHITSDSGKYNFYSDTGSYTIQPLSNFNNFATVPTSQIISRTSYGNKDTINFKLSPTVFVNDASIVLSNNWLTRPNRQGTYTISYTNESGQNYNGTIKLKLDSRLIYQTAIPNPTSIVGDTMIWNITNLPLFTTKNISVNFLASSSLIANDSLKSFVKIYNAQTDVTSTNNQYTLTDIVRASYDPNDKVVDKAILSTTEVAQSPYLYYTIRFQNVGNDTAFDITIKDTLDNNLDWSTFQPIVSSHKYSLEQSNNKYVLFDFKNIKLVDSVRNEKASHGFIAYKIKTKNNLVLGNSVLNRASIIFDVNAPIATNSAKTVIIQTNAGRDTSTCTGQSITLTATGATSYSWSNGSNTASITVSPTTTTSYIVTGTVNGVSQNDTVVVFINPTKTTNRAQTVCQGQFYNFNGTNLSIAGIYRDTLQQVNGCDSFIVLTLNVNPTKTTNRAQTVCQGQIYNFNGTNLSTAGIYRDTLQQVNGCDSFIVLTLNVNPTKTTNRAQTVCQGQIYNFNGTNLSTAGIYRDTLQQVNGCDSFIVLTLNVNPTKTTNRAQTICQGQSYNFNGANLSTAGIYRDTLQQVNGCDSFIVLTLNVNPTKTTNRAQTICQGQIYNFNGMNLSIAGIYRDTLQKVNGCDSFIVLTLNVNPTKTTNRAQTICQGQSYNFNGTNLSIAGIYRDTLQQVNGCDSFIVLTLNVNPTKTTNHVQTICQGQSYNFNGTNLSIAGIYRDTLQQVNGCDSFIVLTLNVNPTKTTNIEQVILSGQNYAFNGMNLSNSGIYRDTLLQSNGCDSFIILTLSMVTHIKNNISFVDNINVYPNPTDNFIKIELNAKKTSSFNITLISIDGKVLTAKEYKNTSNINDAFDLRNYSTGVYLLQIESENEQASYQIIKH